MGAEDIFGRSELLIGKAALEKLKGSRVCVFGVGGVGSYVVEALARSGIGAIDVVDNDTVQTSNINRQIIALNSTVGKNKVDVIKQRILDINPQCIVTAHKCFYLPETADEFDFTQYDYVVDAIDTVTAKIDIIVRCDECGTRVISSMGTGFKLDPGRIRVCDIYSTNTDPLARVMRRELKARGIKSLKVVYSDEPPIRPRDVDSDYSEETTARRGTTASIAFVPSVAGLFIAGEVIRELAGIK